MLKQIILPIIIFSFFLNLNFSTAQVLQGRVQAPVGSVDGRPINASVSGSYNFGGPNQPGAPAQGAPRGRGVSNFGSTSSGCDFLDSKGERPTFGNVGCIINDFTNNVVQMLGTLFGAAALVAFLWGLYLFIFHGADNEAKVKEGKSLMGWGLVALFVMISVWGIVRLAQNIFGVKNETQIVLPSICVGNNCEKGTSSSGKELETSDAGKGEKKNTGTGESNTSVPATPVSEEGKSCSKFTGCDRRDLSCQGTNTFGFNGECRTAAQDQTIQDEIKKSAVGDACSFVNWCGPGLSCFGGFCAIPEKEPGEDRSKVGANCNKLLFQTCVGKKLKCSSNFGPGFCENAQAATEREFILGE